MKPRKAQNRKQHASASKRGKAVPAGEQLAPIATPISIEKLVKIEKAIYGGSFLARDEGKVLFVPFALPGEEAHIRITQDKSKRGFAIAEIEQITNPSADRIAPSCPHFAQCGGCNYQHANYEAQLRYKQAILRETFERSGVIPPEQIDVLSAEPWGNRNRIRLAFDAQGRPGYRAHASHQIVPIEACPIAAPLLVKAALAISNQLRTIQPKPSINELTLFCNAEETELLVSILLASPAKLPLESLASALQQQIPALTGMEVAAEARNAQPPRTLANWGAKSLTYTAAGFPYRVDNGAFFQVNRSILDAFVKRVVSNQSGTLAWDLFAGVGLFSRQLASTFSHVVAVEIAPLATKALEANLSGTSSESIRATTLDFLRRKHTGPRPDLVVVDPPRAGLGAEVTAELAKIAAPKLIYVSCDPTTLARDLRALLASGYTIESAALADLFPQTYHLESIIHLRRQ